MIQATNYEGNQDYNVLIDEDVVALVHLYSDT